MDWKPYLLTVIVCLALNDFLSIALFSSQIYSWHIPNLASDLGNIGIFEGIYTIILFCSLESCGT